MIIFDSFIFYNEIHLVKWRLEELKNVVEFFVLIEGDLTHSGKPKSYYFDELQKQLTKDELAKIIHLKVKLSPSIGAWGREDQQRDLIYNALGDIAAPDDVIMHGDADEIVRASVLTPDNMPKHGELVGLRHRMYYYFINAYQGSWGKQKMCLFGDLPNNSLLNLRHCNPTRSIDDAGWHFSYTGGIGAIQEKLNTFTHTELDKPEYTSADHIADCMSKLKDLFGRDLPLIKVAIDESYPKFIQENQASLEKYIIK